jgi:hypothetical protein
VSKDTSSSRERERERERESVEQVPSYEFCFCQFAFFLCIKFAFLTGLGRRRMAVGGWIRPFASLASVDKHRS